MLRRIYGYLLAALAVPVAAGVWAPRGERFDVLIRGGTVYDGTGAPGRGADVGIRGDTVAAVGDLSSARARSLVDARGLAVAPGFINMLSWSTESLIVDGRSQGEIRQGVTTEIFGEGSSMGPLTDEMKRRMKEEQADFKYDVRWTTLSESPATCSRRCPMPTARVWSIATSSLKTSCSKVRRRS